MRMRLCMGPVSSGAAGSERGTASKVCAMVLPCEKNPAHGPTVAYRGSSRLLREGQSLRQTKGKWQGRLGRLVLDERQLNRGPRPVATDWEVSYLNMCG